MELERYALGELTVPDMLAYSDALKTINPKVEGLEVVGTEWFILASEELSPTELGILDNVVIPAVNMQKNVVKIIKAAIEFGGETMAEFAAENVLMGITQAGKTKSVTDYCTDIIKYISTGSLYEVMNEIDSLIEQGIPGDLAPFITEERLLSFRQKVVDYLGG